MKQDQIKQTRGKDPVEDIVVFSARNHFGY